MRGFEDWPVSTSAASTPSTSWSTCNRPSCRPGRLKRTVTESSTPKLPADSAGAARVHALRRLAAPMRAGEWWEHKLAPILALFYATSLSLDAGIAARLPRSSSCSPP